MVVKRHLDQLQKGAMEWNTWRERNREVPIDLSDADLIRADLSGADLNRADLSDANLNRADLSGTHLSRADLRGAHLSRADLRGAHLSYAQLSRAHLRGAQLSRADLNGANLNGANLRGADLSYAILSKAILSKAILSYTDLSGAIFSNADLSNADLSYTNLSGANFGDTNLSGADLNGAVVGWTVFASLDLRTVKGLETIEHHGPSYISTSTLEKSGGEIPEIFLKGAGVGDSLIEYAHSLFNKPIEYYTCFISYSSKDELFARRLHNDLQQEGVRCWFAPEDMDIGDKIRHRIEESIRLYDKLLLILSEHSIASNWVAYEVERALNKEPQGLPNVLYPVRVDQAILTCSASWAQDIKSTRHVGNFEHWTEPEKYQESFKRLLRALNANKEHHKS